MSVKKRFYLVCYDITDSKRWKKFYKILNGYGQRLQYSVFKCLLTEKQYSELKWKMVRTLEKEDRLLIVPIHPEDMEKIFVLNMEEDWKTERDRFLTL